MAIERINVEPTLGALLKSLPNHTFLTEPVIRLAKYWSRPDGVLGTAGWLTLVTRMRTK